MESLERFNFVKTNYNRHLAQIKERERLDKLISKITNNKKEDKCRDLKNKGN